MNWIKTKWISVPAHKNQTTEVAINEWFSENRSFLLGTPVASQLRGTDGGWAQTMAVAPEPEQDTIALLRDRLNQILETARGDKSKSPQSNNHLPQGDTSMATVIPADKFESNSFYAFILRENPKASGIEIHFPPDATPDPGFIGRVVAAGFKQAHSNPNLWYHNQYSPELMTKARGWVKTCQRFGAYEIDSSEPVEQTKSRRRNGGAKQASPTPTPTTPVGGNKIVDAIAERVQEMLYAMKEELAVKPDTSELYVLREENTRLKAELQESNESRQKHREALEVKTEEAKSLEQERDRANETIKLQKEAIDVAVSEVARLSEIVEERDRAIAQLRQQLAEWGVVDTEPAVPVFEDEPETQAPVFDDESPLFDDEPTNAPNFDEGIVELGELPLPSSSEPKPDDTSEEEGFDFDGLDDAGKLEG